ncbi:hypothetical protein AV955_gp040 [Diadromus pulchellus ascovirus 4a]|uniref:Complete DpAV4 genome n=1 Tax=Diadromus pulchellus ascovirus 4a TaxID=158683 RepID=F2NYW9_9VIRU|nr:hypothetical protein AV955_gp040 [Diadromus pulchellus ascovirus 4a]CCA61397.1 unnamed protein product [Diadromus pulchellus ascovirus 4a]
MGSAISTNSTRIVMKAVTEVANTNIQKAYSDNNQSIVVKIENTGGDVNINNVTVTQRVNVNVGNLLNALTNSTNNEVLNEKLKQSAMSLVEGLNLAQLAASTNVVNQIINNLVTIKNRSINECKNSTTQTFSLDVRNTGGNVNVRDLDIDQDSSTVFKCIQDSKSTADLRRQTDVLIDGLASSKAQGLDTRWLVIGGVALFALLGVGGTFIGAKVIGPVIAVAGAASVYFGYNGTPGSAAGPKLIKTNKWVKSLKNATPTATFTPAQILSKYKKSAENLTDDEILGLGQADVYELLEGTVRLYKSAKPRDAYDAPDDDLGPVALEIIDPVDNTRGISVKLQNRTALNHNFANPVLNILNKREDMKAAGDVAGQYDQSTHTVSVFKFDDPTFTSNVPASVVMIKPEKPKGPVNKQLVYIGYALLATGMVATIMSFRGNGGGTRS